LQLVYIKGISMNELNYVNLFHKQEEQNYAKLFLQLQFLFTDIYHIFTICHQTETQISFKKNYTMFLIHWIYFMLF
jgi:hypothetical protein